MCKKNILARLRWQVVRGPQRATKPYTIIRRFLLLLNSSV